MQTISISRESPGTYHWVLHVGHEILADRDFEQDIESCLKAARSALLDEPLVEIRYRGVIVGTVVVCRLEHEPEVVADWIVDCFSAVAYALH